MPKTRDQITSLEEFLHDELGYKGKKLKKIAEEVISRFEEVIETDGVFAPMHARDLIWEYTNFPPYMDSGASALMNIQDELVDNFMIEIFMRCLFNNLNSDYYVYDKKKNEIKLA